MFSYKHINEQKSKPFVILKGTFDINRQKRSENDISSKGTTHRV